mgnify:CR=1 FL=1
MDRADFLIVDISHRVASSKYLQAMRASMCLIVATFDAEWNQATSKPAARQYHYETQNPCKSALCRLNICQACIVTESTSIDNCMVWPMTTGIKAMLSRLLILWIIKHGLMLEVHVLELLLLLLTIEALLL